MVSRFSSTAADLKPPAAGVSARRCRARVKSSGRSPVVKTCRSQRSGRANRTRRRQPPPNSRRWQRRHDMLLARATRRPIVWTVLSIIELHHGGKTAATARGVQTCVQHRMTRLREYPCNTMWRRSTGSVCTTAWRDAVTRSYFCTALRRPAICGLPASCPHWRSAIW